MSTTPHPERTTQILLPFAEKEYVDMARVQRILDIDHNTIYRMRRSHYPDGRPLLDVVDYGSGRLKRVKYSSLVEFCDHLRVRYGIIDRRPQLENALLRHKDEDLLPFPLTDTITSETARQATGYESPQSIRMLIESGAFEAYRILEEGGSPWRISRTSFLHWLESCRNRQPR